MSTSAPSLRRSSPRVEGDPDKYLRVVKCGKIQARPYLEGVRYNLGLFQTKHQARKAVAAFWWGQIKERFRFARPYHARPGLWIAVVYLPTRSCAASRERVRVGESYPSAQAAHEAACAYLRKELGPLVAMTLIEPAHGDRRAG
jgi:hypothetical protein